MKKSAAASLLVLVLAVVGASASVVYSIPGGTLVPMPAVNSFGGGPQTFGTTNMVTWSSTNVSNQGGSVFGLAFVDPVNNGLYSLGTNGNWNPLGGPYLPPAAALNDSTDFYGVADTMTFAFASPVSSVGGFMNFSPSISFPPNPTTIAVYDSGMNLIESTDLNNQPFPTTGADNSGLFVGFQESGPNIKYFTLTDNYVAITDLTYATVPEPGSMLLLGSGLLGACAYSRRRLGL
jgi:hypothetical protein